MTVPLYCGRCCSSHWTDSASRWLVGSSSNRMSGSWISSRQSATRRFSPPDSTSTWVSGGGHRRASMAISSWFSSSQPLTASICSCRRLCFSSSFSISSGESSSPSRLRSEEHTSELQSPCNLVCRLLLEKKKKRV